MSDVPDGSTLNIQIHAADPRSLRTYSNMSIPVNLPVPDAPELTELVRGDTQMYLTFIGDYQEGWGHFVEHSSDGGVSWSMVEVPPDTQGYTTVTGLTNGTQYMFRVLITNPAGASEPSATATATPLACPSEKAGDWEAPVISNVSASPSVAVSGGPIEIFWTVADESGVVAAQVDDDAGSGRHDCDVSANRISSANLSLPAGGSVSLWDEGFSTSCGELISGDMYLGDYRCRYTMSDVPDGSTLNIQIHAEDPRSLGTYSNMSIPVSTEPAS